VPMRIRRFLYAAALLTPVVVVGLNSPPFIETSRAAAVTNRLFGPNFPALLDTNGNGIPDAGDAKATPTRVGNVVTLISPFDCNSGDGDNQFTLGPGTLGGLLNTATRNSDGGRTQELDITAGTGGKATAFSFSEKVGGTAIGTGIGSLQDTNLDGAFETFSANGSTNGGKTVGTAFSLVFGDTNGDGIPDYVSIPWALSDLFGVNPSDPCSAGANPQVWIPLADSNGDGQPDSIIPDLDGNGVPDPDSFTSPPLVAAAVPTVNSQWMTALTVLLSGLALWMLRRREVGLEVR
jgi:hypothetical protein